MTWIWVGPPTYRYRDTDTGKFVSQQQIIDWSDESILSTADTVRLSVQVLESGTIGDWQQFMRDTITKEITRQYLLGIGGKNAMTPSDYGSIGGMVAEQFRYLDDFVANIADGKYSLTQIAAYAAMYIKSAREAFERASAKVRGIPDMPAYPGDGSSCLGLTNCGCHWEYHFRKGRWECYWKLGATEHCELCLQHAQEWSPLIVEREE